MEEENLDSVGIESAQECESIPELGESSLSVGGERDASTEDKTGAATGGEEGVLENHVEEPEPEFVVEHREEMVEQPVVVAEEDRSEIIAAQNEDPALEFEADEETTNDAKREAADTDTGDALLYAESQVDTGGDELLVDPELKMKGEKEFAPVVDTEIEMVVTDFESQMNAIGDEMPVDRELGMKIEEEFTALVDPILNVVVTDVTDAQVEARGDGLQMTMQELEVGDHESERDMDDGENVEAVGRVDNERVEGQTFETNTETSAKGDEADEEKAEVVVNDSEVEAAEKPAVIGEEKVDLITEEMPMTELRRDAEIVTEIDADTVDAIEQEYEHTENNEVAVEESGVSSNLQLDEHVNVAEEDTSVKEPPIGMTKTEIEADVELELKRDVVVEEIPVAVDEVVAEMGSEIMADQIPDEDGKMDTEETASDVDEPGQDMYDSPAALQDDEEDDTAVAEDDTGAQDTEMETETDIAESGKTSGGKRKRNKSLKSTPILKATAKPSSRKTVGEDVCFICFDGGELVLCDRRGCPKAYHPSCVNRDEAFFKSKGRWNCGWHLCSICEKNARYMCYTCTFSLCKSCTKDAVILSVRGNKGFCETCMRTVMLIENNEHGNNDTQVDFDDRSSWEFLFKDYYIELKAKLSLSSVEIAEAKNPWKGAENMSGPSKQDSSEAQGDANEGGSGSEDSIENSEIVRPKRRKIRKQSKSRSKEEELVSTGIAAGDKTIRLSDNSEWASKELLEFVSHMKDGDTSVLSQFDVQALLLEYIKRNKLRDPRRKSQIICDARLETLFGKPRVGHFEMLKLLESHFLVRDEHNDDFQGSVVDTENNQLDTDTNADILTKGVKDKKRKSRRKGDSRGPQSNLDDYAAINMHNIGLIYLRRKLMEDLLEDAETFHDKVVGTFVRIRISGSNQKQDLYRLVQVVGTSKVAEYYKICKKTTDIMVEILNLDKTEIIPIDTISNQEFTEDECKRLRQSIKCGLISPLTVGEILDKTTEIQAARVNDWLESEVLRLSHLRDRASDLGRRKELRECVEKLQLLKTPEERRRRLEEVPEIQADPKMDPSYESDDDSENEDSRRDAFMRSRGISRRGRAPISPGSENSVKDSWSAAGKVTSKNWESSRTSPGNNFSINASHIGETATDNSWNLEKDKDTQEFNTLEKLNSATTNSESTEWGMRNVSRTDSFSRVPSVSSQAGIVDTAVKINESEKMWHYQDPSGKVQGPFSMVQLRKWNNTGYFPAGLKIWRTTEKQENSILLADALVGKFPKELPAVDNMSPVSNSAGHSGKTSVTSLSQDRERSIVDQNSGSRPIISAENWRGNDNITNLPSPTPRQSNVNRAGGESSLFAVQSPGVNGVVPSPTAVQPITGSHTSTPASVLNAVIQTTAFSPSPNSQQSNLLASAVSLHTQSTMTSESHEAPVHGHQPVAVQPAQTVTGQNLQAGAQSGQLQGGYGWGTPSVQNSSGSFPNSGSTIGAQHDMWRPPAQGNNVPNMQPPATPNASWGIGPADSNSPMGVRPENPNIGWGSNTMQANPNMGVWMNPAPANANMNWVPAMQVAPAPGSFVAPLPANSGANVQAMVPGNVNPGWAPPQTWGGAPPVQGAGPVPGNGWAPPSGNAGGPPPTAVQGPPQGNLNQGWGGGAPPSRNHMGGQFQGQRGGRGSGFGGDRPWNRQSSFGGGGSRSKRDTVCPYNANGRCRKGAHCNYLHV